MFCPAFIYRSTPILQLTSTLSLVVVGGFQHSVGCDYLVGMSQNAISKIASNMIKKMEMKLCPRHINFETENQHYINILVN